MSEFILPIRVYYEDTDAGGVVYNANYLKFMERCRTEWLNELGFFQDQLFADDVAFAVAKAEIRWLKPARLNQRLLVKAKVKSMRGASLEFEQSITAEEGDQVYAHGIIKVVCIKLSDFSPQPIPKNMMEVLRRVS